jgi:hypothetical protein
MRRELSLPQKIIVLSAMAITLLAVALWFQSGAGFCINRHNGIYCYTGVSQTLMSSFLVGLSTSLFVGIAELVTKKRIIFLKAKLPLVIALLSMPLFWASLYYAGQNA